MPDDRVEIRDGYVRTNWTWTRLFEAFWIALLDPGKLLLAAAAIVVMYIGLGTLSWVFGPSTPPIKPPEPADYTAEKFLDEAKGDSVRAKELADRKYEAAKEKFRSDWDSREIASV